MKDNNNTTDAARELTLAEKIERELASRGISEARPSGFRSLGTSNYLERNGRDGLQRRSMKG